MRQILPDEAIPADDCVRIRQILPGMRDRAIPATRRQKLPGGNGHPAPPLERLSEIYR
jgi:hypothetical protein